MHTFKAIWAIHWTGPMHVELAATASSMSFLSDFLARAGPQILSQWIPVMLSPICLSLRQILQNRPRYDLTHCLGSKGKKAMHTKQGPNCIVQVLQQFIHFRLLSCMTLVFYSPPPLPHKTFKYAAPQVHLVMSWGCTPFF